MIQRNLDTPPAPSFALLQQRETIYPLVFSAAQRSGAADVYLKDASVRKLVGFFEAKGLRAIKDEDAREQWYEDWLAFQAEHRLYASVLSPRQYSTLGFHFDLLRLTRFLEVFAYFSPAHGYSLQVTFLGLYSILMGSNEALKREAVAALEAGGLLAFGVSEKSHGSDLLANEFTIREVGAGRYLANGTKYYIGNCNAASIISILARKEDLRSDGRKRRAPFALFALRPDSCDGFTNVRKIRTLGVRAAFVGEFEVKDHEVSETDMIAEGRDAWDAVFGTVTLGKFFLGFGSIGICEHALREATTHTGGRILFGKPVLEMPHIRLAMAEAYARLTAMKLYGYRALDYVNSASAADRRYLLFCAVQKAKVSTEGVKVMALLSECVGAMGFEADTYFEMALRDAQLIPRLEGSTHVNFAVTAQFAARYLAHPDPNLQEPGSMVAGESLAEENPYLAEARTGAFNTIAFPRFLCAYRPLMNVPNVRCFVRQAMAFRVFVRRRDQERDPTDTIADNTQYSLVVGQCLATIAYGQLIAENSTRLNVAPEVISVIFHLLVNDLTAMGLLLAALPRLDAKGHILARRLLHIPETTAEEWELVCARLCAVTPVLTQADPSEGRGA